MYEICKLFNFLEVSYKTKEINHLDICSFPGAFILAVNHYLKTILKLDYKFKAISYLDTSKEYFKDEFSLHKKYPDNYDFGIYKGDVSNYKNVEYYIHKYKNNFDVITSDCGTCGSGVERSEKFYKVIFGQLLITLGCLKKGGNFVMKCYYLYHNIYLDMVDLLTSLFTECRMIKPYTSRNYGGNECYILCKEYNGIEEEKLLELLELLKKDNFIDYKLFNSKPKNIEAVKEFFQLFIDNKNKWRELKKKFKFEKLDNPEEYYQKKLEVKKIFSDKIVEWGEWYMEEMDYKKIKMEDNLV